LKAFAPTVELELSGHMQFDGTVNVAPANGVYILFFSDAGNFPSSYWDQLKVSSMLYYTDA